MLKSRSNAVDCTVAKTSQVIMWRSVFKLKKTKHSSTWTAILILLKASLALSAAVRLNSASARSKTPVSATEENVKLKSRKQTSSTVKNKSLSSGPAQDLRYKSAKAESLKAYGSMHDNSNIMSWQASIIVEVIQQLSSKS